MLTVWQNWYYCNYDAKCCLSVWYVMASYAIHCAHLVYWLTIYEGASEGVEGSKYIGYTKLQANSKLDYWVLGLNKMVVILE